MAQFSGGCSVCQFIAVLSLQLQPSPGRPVQCDAFTADQSPVPPHVSRFAIPTLCRSVPWSLRPSLPCSKLPIFRGCRMLHAFVTCAAAGGCNFPKCDSSRAVACPSLFYFTLYPLLFTLFAFPRTPLQKSVSSYYIAQKFTLRAISHCRTAS
jgi:hypothetical protein